MNNVEQEVSTTQMGASDSAIQAYDKKCREAKKRREALNKTKKITLDVLAYACVVIFMIVAALMISVALSRS